MVVYLVCFFPSSTFGVCFDGFGCFGSLGARALGASPPSGFQSSPVTFLNSSLVDKRTLTAASISSFSKFLNFY
jgi:hypothetical protein